MHTHPLSPTMPSETLTSCWATAAGDSMVLGAGPTPKALIARRRCTSATQTTNLGVRSPNLFGRATSVQNWARQNRPFLRLNRRRACAAIRFSTP